MKFPIKSSIIKEALKLTTIEYMKETSLTGFKLIFLLDESRVLQILWIPFLLLGMFCAVYISGHYVIFFLLNPSVTNIDSFEQPAEQVPFPAVSICSVNKISAQAMGEYANHFSKLNRSANTGGAGTLDKFDLFGGFYDFGSFDIDDGYRLQRYLDKFDSENEGFFNVTNVLRRLSPKCEHLLQKCHWEGVNYPCTELFELTATPEGFCCAFNYNRPGRQTRKPSLRYLKSIGPDKGLKILLNTSVDDYFFTQRSSLGFIVQIYNSLLFPDVLTGGLTEFPVPPQSDVSAALVLTTLVAENEVREFSVSQRGCYFSDELPRQYGAWYSQSECLLRCKLRSIKSLCNCIPYYTPDDLINWELPVMYCTLSHLECLSRYKLTWIAYRPVKEIIGLEQAMEDSLNCIGCLPLCHTSEYDFRLDTSDFVPEHDLLAFDGFLDDVKDLSDTSLLRIYYSTPYAMQYKKRAIYTTTGMYANIGGILGISIGCSVICIIEFVYFATVKFYYNLKRLRQIDEMKSNKILFTKKI